MRHLTLLAILALGCTESGSGLKVHNSDPNATIDSPTDGATVLEGQVFTLSGTVGDPEDPMESLKATWTVDGTAVCADLVPDASGLVTCETSFTADATVGLKVTDSKSATAEDTAQVTVEANAAPQILIVRPDPTLAYYVDLPIGIELTLADDRDSASALSVAWQSGATALTIPDGSAGDDGVWTGSLTGLGEGTQVLKATVTDTGGKTATASVTLVVYGENTVPTCTFVAPAEDSCFVEGEAVLFEGTARDTETAPDRLLVSLSSDRDGVLTDAITPTTSGTWTRSVDALSAGTHTTTLTVEDGYGDRCVASQVVEISDAVWFRDGDGDGFGDPGDSVAACDAPSGFVAVGTDCDDGDLHTFPGAARFESATACMTDVDGDGYGASLVVAGADAGTDCDDDNDAISPSAAVVCDGIDNDCYGGVDDDVTTTFYADTDGDGYGDAASTTEACTVPSGHVPTATDCDDTAWAVNPGATEICDAADKDEDCSGTADDADTGVDVSTQTAWYADSDGDGYGDPASTTAACDQPSAHVSDDTDCDDSAFGVNPSATEVCDAADTDEDCSGAADDADTGVDVSTQSTWYADGDGDGYGDPSSTTAACDQPSAHVSDNTDCDDSAFGVNTSATEVCDPADTDEDCSGAADDADAGVDVSTQSTWYADGDGDGEGNASSTLAACDTPSSYVATATDCDDSDATVGLTATEICDGQDNDCDTLADDDDPSLDSSTATTWYADADGDGYGDSATSALTCAVPSGHGTDDADCDDADAWTHPGATELCDGVQNDCDNAAWVDDAGIVSFEDSAASWSDVSSTWAAGISALPASIPLASDGTVHVCEGTWYVALDVSADVDVVGEDDATDVILDGGGNDTPVSILMSGITVGLADLTITDGVATHTPAAVTTTDVYGGGLFCDAASGLELSGVVFDSNTADRAGAAFAGSGCTVTADAVDWTNNSAVAAGAVLALLADWDETDGSYASNTASTGGAGALYYVYSDGSCVDCVFDSNSATSSGGGAVLVSYGTVDLAGSLFTNNTAWGSGGALWTRASSVVSLSDGAELSSNTASSSGGAVYMDGGALLTLTNTTVSGNSALYDGGAFYVNGGDLALGAATVASGNSAGEEGGVVYVKGTGSLTMDTAALSANSATSDGGAIYMEGACTLDVLDSDFDANTAGRYGGAIHSLDDVTIAGSTFTDNTAFNQGGALFLTTSGTLEVSDTTFDGNSATTTGADGGALFLQGDTVIDTCSFTDNVVADDGGAMFIEAGPVVSITDSDFDGNTASSSGGAILNDASTTTITGCSFTNNGAYWGAAVYDYDSTGSLTIDDTDITGNTASGGGGAGMSYQGGVIRVSNSNISSNAATAIGGDGGAFYIGLGGVLAISSSTLTSNTAADHGGSIAASGSTTSVALTDTAITSCTAGTYGGGISVSNYLGRPTLTVTRGSITSNIAGTSGGGIYADATVTATSVNMGGTNIPDDTRSGSDADTWGTSASFSCSSSTGCN